MAQGKSKPAKGAKKVQRTESAEKRTYFEQADLPQTTLQQAQKIASAIVDNFASSFKGISRDALVCAITWKGNTPTQYRSAERTFGQETKGESRGLRRFPLKGSDTILYGANS